MISRRASLAGAAVALVADKRSAHATVGQGSLSAAFARIEASHKGRLGVSVLDTGTGEQAGHRVAERFPLGSTYKLLAAAAVLARVDAGQDRLDSIVHYTRDQLVAYSPITEAHAGYGMSLDALCDAAITYSDNTAGNLLLDALGGPAQLTAYLRGIGDTLTRLDRTEPAVNEALPGDPRDTTSPAAMLADIKALTDGTALSRTSSQRLQGWLMRNTTGGRRLRATLPPAWIAGEKTGTADHGTSNDVGLLWPPAGAAPVLVAAFITEGPSDAGQRDAVLAAVGEAVASAWTAGR